MRSCDIHLRVISQLDPKLLFWIHWQNSMQSAEICLRSPLNLLLGILQKPQKRPVSLSQSGAKSRKINRPWLKSIQFWNCLKYISIPNFRPLLPCVLQKMTRNPKYDQFHWVEVVPKVGKSTDHNPNLFSSEGGQDTSAYQIPGHSSHAFSRKCPEI